LPQRDALLIDVTEVYLLARKGEEVTGIQRVVLEFAHELCALGLAVPVAVHPFDKRLTALPATLFDLADLYDVRRFIEFLGLPPKVRNLDKYRDRPVSRAYHGMLQRLRQWRWQWRGHGTGPSLVTTGGRYVLLGSIETNRRTARVIRLTDPSAIIHAMIYDIIPLRLPHDSPGAPTAFAAAFADLVQAGAHFVTDSVHARDDLLAAVAEGLLPAPAGPVDVLPLAAELREPTGPGRERPGQPYLLMVGSITGRKNATAVFEAYRRLTARGVALPLLVCAGRMPANAATAFEPGGAWADLAGLVRLVDQPDHATLHALYAGATALVFPSRYEGYGLPLGEAQWLGVPVLSSSATSLPEAGGDAPAYFAPDDIDALAALIERVATDPAWLAALRARTAAARPGLRTWRECALRLHAIATAQASGATGAARARS
jgi:glycosyltransferase involved in cell wall biosynthesis